MANIWMVKSSTWAPNYSEPNHQRQVADRHEISSGTKQDPHLTQFDISACLIEALLVLCLLRLAPAGQHGLWWPRRIVAESQNPLRHASLASNAVIGIMFTSWTLRIPPLTSILSRTFACRKYSMSAFVRSQSWGTSFVGKDWSTQSTGILSQDISNSPKRFPNRLHTDVPSSHTAHPNPQSARMTRWLGSSAQAVLTSYGGFEAWPRQGGTPSPRKTVLTFRRVANLLCQIH